MTYCCGILVREGLVMIADTRTNAGLDNISTFRKLHVFSNPGERVLAISSAGNLAISQSAISTLTEGLENADTGEIETLMNAPTMFKAAQRIGRTIRHVRRLEGSALKAEEISFDVSFLFGGQIRGESMRLFQVYSAGNFIEATAETPYFQIGEYKYGKPVLDRVLTPDTDLDEAAKCALVSMDSTMKSNLSVGPPLDLVVYEANRFETDKVVCIDAQNPYYRMLHMGWGQKLREVFDSLGDPVWDESHTDTPLRTPAGGRAKPLKKITRPDEKLI